MPAHFRETFKLFCQSIGGPQYDATFLLPQFPRENIMLSISTRVETDAKSLHPDARLALSNTQKAFWVMEVSYSQKETNTCRKVHIYILATNDKIRIVILTIITMKSRESKADNSFKSSLRQSRDHGTIHTHV